MGEPHAAYVVASYVISAIAIGGLVIDTLLRGRHWRSRAESRVDRTERNEPR